MKIIKEIKKYLNNENGGPSLELLLCSAVGLSFIIVLIVLKDRSKELADKGLTFVSQTGTTTGI